MSGKAAQVDKPIRIMISSRCNDPIQLDGDKATLSDLRRRLKEHLENTELLGRRPFSVWICEDATSDTAHQDSWDHCLQQARDSDVFLVLSNGNSGWEKEKGVGICHAEMMAVVNTEPAKLRIVVLTDSSREESEQDRAFRRYVDTFFRGRAAKDGNDAIKLAKDCILDAVVKLVHLGVRETRKGRFDRGDALEWSRVDFGTRREFMVNSLPEFDSKRPV